MTAVCYLSLQSRVISVHSYYLTSLVNLAFYGFPSLPACSKSVLCYMLFSILNYLEAVIVQKHFPFRKRFLIGPVYFGAFGFYLYIGITLSDYNLAQRNRKSNTQYCTKCTNKFRTYRRKRISFTKKC